ncbi:hypothetical protein HDU92_008766, partial [Lobulomyces angularis]
VLDIIFNLGYKKSLEKKILNPTIEFKVVQDADRLDAIGAIGIARAFTYGATKNAPFYNSNLRPRSNLTSKEYETKKNTDSSTINHFYEKLVLLKDLLNTNEGLKIANQRHQFMLSFLDQFHNEIII